MNLRTVENPHSFTYVFFPMLSLISLKILIKFISVDLLSSHNSFTMKVLYVYFLFNLYFIMRLYTDVLQMLCFFGYKESVIPFINAVHSSVVMYSFISYFPLMSPVLNFFKIFHISSMP